MRNISTTVRAAAELEEKGRQQAADVTFGGILEVKVIVRGQCQLVLSQIVDILNYGGADKKYEFLVTKASEKPRTTRYFFLHRLRMDQ
jgi:hypothetical protein